MYTDDQLDIPKYSDEGKMPVFLKVLLILTSITVGFGILAALVGFAKGPNSQEDIDSIMAPNLALINNMRNEGYTLGLDELEKITRQVDHINQNFYLNQSLSLVAYTFGLAGILMMFKQRKIGFHLYIIYNLIAFSTVYFVVPIAEISTVGQIVNFIICGVFIFLYSRNLFWLTN